MLRTLAVTFCISLSAAACFSQANSQVLKVTSPVYSLGSDTALGALTDTAEPAKSLVLNPKIASDLLKSLCDDHNKKSPVCADPNKPTIIHLLRWKDAKHASVTEKWYFYDPAPPVGGFYLQSAESIFQRTAIPGYQNIQFVYIHLNFSLTAGMTEWASLPTSAATIQSVTLGAAGSISAIVVQGGGSGYSEAPSCTIEDASGTGATCTAAVANGAITSISVTSGGSGYTSPTVVLRPTTLLHPISYSITVTKAQTQFIQDLKTALQVLGLPSDLSVLKLAPVPPSYGYFSFSTFTSQWTTSSIAVAASLDSSSPPKTQGVNKPSATGASNSLSSNTYTNEKPSYVGLSAGVQITSYKDVTFQSSSGTLVPNSITKQGVYFFLDGYYPGVLPSLRSFRYIPHPFFGLPIKGEVLRHSMLGVGVGLHWLEPFGGVIFDTQNNQVKNGNTSIKTGITYQFVFGLKVSMTAVGKALAKK